MLVCDVDYPGWSGGAVGSTIHWELTGVGPCRLPWVVGRSGRVHHTLGADWCGAHGPFPPRAG